MLKKMNLAKHITKEEYRTVIGDHSLKLAKLQRAAKDAGIPVMIVFEGWEAAGKGTLINNLILPLDPRGFKVYLTKEPTEEESYHPFLWRFWRNTPAKGSIAIFDRSWYRRVSTERVENATRKKEVKSLYDEICAFEKQLSDEGTVIVKFFLHIDRKEQAKRFNKMANDAAMKWKVTKDDWRQNRRYDLHRDAFEEMIGKTNLPGAPWIVIESIDERYATVTMISRLIDMLEHALTLKNTLSAKAHITSPSVIAPVSTGHFLDAVDPSCSLTREEYDRALRKCQAHIRELEYTIYKKRVPVLVMYEGWDAAGKGGNIRRLTQHLDPRGYQVVSVAAPNDIQRAHHYLWRFWQDMPKAGHIAIFDRTWYGRVLVERIEGFCSKEQWMRAYDEINETEAQLARYGMILVKFWLHIDSEEQLRRFEERQQVDYKQWKITDEDWRNREKWSQYKIAVDDMIAKTSTSHAPWTIVESNSKYYARIKTLRTVIDAIEKQI